MSKQITMRWRSWCLSLWLMSAFPLNAWCGEPLPWPQEGRASWYGGGEALATRTASGEVFNPTQLTAAMWEVPFGTQLQVTNLRTGRTVVVRVNDRGPARRLGRRIDLSRAAFAAIAPLEQGICQVRIAPLAPPGP